MLEIYGNFQSLSQIIYLLIGSVLQYLLDAIVSTLAQTRHRHSLKKYWSG
jgi:uncharacterized membrane protein YuzA (DUF378 family)